MPNTRRRRSTSSSGDKVKPIPVSAEIVTYLDPKKRLDFLSAWKAAVAAGAAGQVRTAAAAHRAAVHCFGTPMTSAANRRPAGVRRLAAAAFAAVPAAALTILLTAAAVLAPLALILYQSFLTAPFFDARKTVGLGAYEFIFADPDFWKALAQFAADRDRHGR